MRNIQNNPEIEDNPEWTDGPLYVEGMEDRKARFDAMTIQVDPNGPPPPDLRDEPKTDEEEQFPANVFLLSMDAQRLASLFSLFKVQPRLRESALVEFEQFLAAVPLDREKASEGFAFHAVNLFRDREFYYAGLAVNEALTRNPKQPLAELVGGELYRKNNRLTLAAEAYRRVMTLENVELAEVANKALESIGMEFDIF